jgi:hypothetical protein
VVEVIGEAASDSSKVVPGTAEPSKPEGLAFDKSIGRLLYPGPRDRPHGLDQGSLALLKGDGIRMWQSGTWGIDETS